MLDKEVSVLVIKEQCQINKWQWQLLSSSAKYQVALPAK